MTKRRFTSASLPWKGIGSSTRSDRSLLDDLDAEESDQQVQPTVTNSRTSSTKAKKKWGRKSGGDRSSKATESRQDDDLHRKIGYVDVVRKEADGTFAVIDENNTLTDNTVDPTETIIDDDDDDDDLVEEEVLSAEDLMLYEALGCISDNGRYVARSPRRKAMATKDFRWKATATNEVRSNPERKRQGDTAPAAAAAAAAAQTAAAVASALVTTVSDNDDGENENDDTVRDSFDDTTLGGEEELPSMSKRGLVLYEALECLAPTTTQIVLDDHRRPSNYGRKTVGDPKNGRRRSRDAASSSKIPSSTKSSWFGPPWWSSKPVDSGDREKTSAECRDDDNPAKENEENETAEIQPRVEEDSTSPSDDGNDHGTVEGHDDDNDDGLGSIHQDGPNERLVLHYQQLAADILESRETPYAPPAEVASDNAAAAALKERKQQLLDPIFASKSFRSTSDDEVEDADEDDNINNTGRKAIGAAFEKQEQQVDLIFSSKSFHSAGDDDEEEEDEIELLFNDEDDDNGNLMIHGPSRSILGSDDGVADAADIAATTIVGGENAIADDDNNCDAEAEAVFKAAADEAAVPFDEASSYEEVPFDEVDEGTRTGTESPAAPKKNIPPTMPEPLWVRNHDKRNELAWVRCAPRNRNKPMEFPISKRPLRGAAPERQRSPTTAWLSCTPWCTYSCGEDFDF